MFIRNKKILIKNYDHIYFLMGIYELKIKLFLKKEIPKTEFDVNLWIWDAHLTGIVDGSNMMDKERLWVWAAEGFKKGQEEGAVRRRRRTGRPLRGDKEEIIDSISMKLRAIIGPHLFSGGILLFIELLFLKQGTAKEELPANAWRWPAARQKRINFHRPWQTWTSVVTALSGFLSPNMQTFI